MHNQQAKPEPQRRPDEYVQEETELPDEIENPQNDPDDPENY
jgi:hypothetical protein